MTDPDAIVVVPPGSRIATSRINFKLLAREAAERRMNVVAVSDEPQVRALAISAGLPAYDSITAAEQALATFREQDRRLNERIDRTMPREHPDPASRADMGGTRVMPVANEPPSVTARRTTGYDAVPIDTAVLPAQQAATAARSRRRRRVSRSRRCSSSVCCSCSLPASPTARTSSCPRRRSLSGRSPPPSGA